MSDLADVAISTDDGIVTASITGEVDLSNFSELERAIASSVPNVAYGVIVDLSGLGYIDSSGIRLLFDLSSRAHARGQGMAVVAPPGSRARRVMDLVGAGSALSLVHTAADARDQVTRASRREDPSP
jgi:anti-anti-sigma factor